MGKIKLIWNWTTGTREIKLIIELGHWYMKNKTYKELDHWYKRNKTDNGTALLILAYNGINGLIILQDLTLLLANPWH